VRRSAPGPRARVRFELRAKPTGLRVLCHLDPALATAYARAVAAVAPAVERALGPEVVAERVASVSDVPPGVVLRPWRSARTRFEQALRRWPLDRGILRTDVATCYGAIERAAVLDALLRLQAPARAAEECAAVLGELASEGVEGLPIGPQASAVLANAVLSAGDAAVRGAGIPFLRWVDDWWLSVGSTDTAGDVLTVLAGPLSRFGLRLNAAKTRFVDRSAAGGPGSTPEYHRAADAHPLPGFARPHALVPADRGVGARRRPTRATRGER
jgi:hypothetical protein